MSDISNVEQAVIKIHDDVMVVFGECEAEISRAIEAKDLAKAEQLRHQLEGVGLVVEKLNIRLNW